jgi:hypothetical protein
MGPLSRFLSLFILVLLLVTGAAVSVSSAEGDGKVRLRSACAAIKPKLDGVIDFPEWSDVLPYHVSLLSFRGTASMDCELFIKNDHTNLYIGLRIWDATRSLAKASGDSLNLYFDQGPEEGNRDGKLTSNSEDGKQWFASDTPGRPKLFVDWFFLERDWELDEKFGGTNDGLVCGDYHKDHWDIECQIPLNSGDRYDMRVQPGIVLGFAIHYREHDTGTWFIYPMDAGYKDPTNWADLFLAVPMTVTVTTTMVVASTALVTTTITTTAGAALAELTTPVILVGLALLLMTYLIWSRKAKQV